jgi:hypothetical protein
MYQVFEEWDASIFKVGTFYQIKEHYTPEGAVTLTNMRT